MYKALYVDDQAHDQGTQEICKFLHLEGVLECQMSLPPRDLVLPWIPDVLLVDLDLSTKPLDGPAVSYYGSTLAAELRIRIPTCPIVLITRRSILIGRSQLSQLLMKSGDIDLILYKDEILRDPDTHRAMITTLIDGFKALEEVESQDWHQVLLLMGASEAERDMLREAAPPLEEHRWNVPQVARWIRDVVMGFPGILYDELTTATRLGVDLTSFRLPAVQALLAPARYTGVFSTDRRCWWRDRVFSIAQDLVLANELTGSIAESFGAAFMREYQQPLEPAVCIYDGTPIADWVCHILRQPVKQLNSLPYYPDSRPVVMDQARVSFKAIEEDDRFDERLVDADSKAVVARLWK